MNGIRTRPAMGLVLVGALTLFACESDPGPKKPTQGTTPATAGASVVATVASGTTTSHATTSVTGTPSTSGAATVSPAPAKVPSGMVRVPGGVYIMGAHYMRGNPDERPAHEAVVADFFMDLTEVTVGAYRACVTAKQCPRPHVDHRFCDFDEENKEDFPINCTDLRQATTYCEAQGKRLPTEREWEYAASNGNKRQKFSWGNNDPTPKISCYYHGGGSCRVKSFASGAFGLYDMTGNVWEWTSSRFATYPSHPRPDPIVDKKLYVYKGGSWSRRFPKWMRNLNRNRYEADKYSASIGFRCAKDVTPTTCPKETSAKDGVCQRSSGTVTCEPNFAFQRDKCRPDYGGGSRVAAASSPGASPATSPAGSSAPSPPDTISRMRTPKHDKDCKRFWPKTPASFLFRGGPNYPSRKPTVRAAGCVPRDMGVKWTSACCPG